MDAPTLHLQQSRDDNTLVFHLSGRLTAEILRDLSEAVDRAESENPSGIHFDMDMARYVDSRCVGALLGWHRHFSTRGIDFRLINVHGEALDVLRVLNLENVFNIGPRPKDIEALACAQRKALWASHEYVEQIVLALGAGLIGLNSEGLVLFLNGAGESLLGCREADVIGRPLHEAFVIRDDAGKTIHPDHCLMLAASRGAAQPVHADIRFGRRGVGEPQPFRITARSIHAKGKPIGAIVGLLDIGAQKQAEAEMAERDAFNFALFQYSPLEMIVVDREGLVVKSNKAMQNSGRALPAAGDAMYGDYEPEHDRDMRAEMMDSIKTGQARKFIEKTGENRVRSIFIMPFPKGAIITSRDNVERGVANMRMTYLNECFMSLGADPAENTNRLVAFLGAQLDASCAFYFRHDGKDIALVGQWKAPAGDDAILAASQGLCNDAMAYDGPLPMVARDLPGAPSVPARSDSTPLAMRTFVGYPVRIEGKPAGVLCAYFDTEFKPTEDDKRLVGVAASAIATEEKRRLAEQEKNDLQEHMRQSQRIEALGRLAGGVAHDFNNLLTVISCSTETLMITHGPEHPVYRLAERMHTAAAAGANLTRQLLAFGRRQALQPKVIDLNAVIANLQKMLRRLIGEDIEFITALNPGVGHVRADPGQIEQVIINLAVNARDAMPQGGRLVVSTVNLDPDSTELRRLAPPAEGPVATGMPGAAQAGAAQAGAAQAGAAQAGAAPLAGSNYVLMSVSDSGCGMDAETRERIFEPFFTTKEKGKGTGLGLSMVYGIVKQSGGSITVDSEPGAGSVFKVFLPRVDEPVDRQEEARLAPVAPAKRPSETVLVVEDERVVRDLIVEILSRHGYETLAAANGEEALEVSAYHNGPIDLLLTDVVMPRMRGQELAQRLSQKRPQTRVLYTSGYTDITIAHRKSMKRGAFFLEKPFSEAKLIVATREALCSTPTPVG